MLKKITEVKKANEALDNSVICCREIDEEGNDSYKYITNVGEFISFLELNNSQERCDVEYSTYDILEKDVIEDGVFFPGFLGEIFSVVSLSSPKYSGYLKSFDTDSYTVDYSEPVYKLSDFSLVSEDEYSLYNPKGCLSIEGAESKGSDSFVVSNFKKDDFKEVDGYLYLGKKTGVKFFSERTYLNMSELDQKNLGLKENGENDFLMIKIMLISFGDEIVDFIALGDETVEQNYDNDSDFDTEYAFVEPSIVEYEGSIEEAEDWGEQEETDDMDVEFDVEIDVIEEIKSKNNLDHIDDIDDDIDLGDL